MFRRRIVDVYASEISELLNRSLVGPDFIVRGPGSLKYLREQTIIYADKLSEEELQCLTEAKQVLLLIGSIGESRICGCSYIVTPHPRLDFVRVLNEFFVERESTLIHPTAKIYDGAKIGRNVSVGVYSIIGPDVVLGNNSIVLNHVVINGSVIIGCNCLIKDNATIGSEGFSFEFDETGVPVHFPYLGRIVIGDNVWIGANSTFERGEMGDTVIEDSVKIDDLVQIGQGCIIGARTMITAGAVISANSKIGKDCWIAPNVSVSNQVIIDDNVLVGIGAVVVKNLAANSVYVGNPARFLRRR
jgi:UDP-3-O-[3-hydroxymyristoyl] glucosamine N-acyltransferase